MALDDGSAAAAGRHPEASIVIPVHGQWALTAQCLDSIFRQSDRASFEIIVVDDCSPDDTAQKGSEIEDVTLVSTPRNVGFVGACNLGASLASAGVIVFLNNDTIVHDGWLDALLTTLDGDPRIGLAGSLLLSADGIVQESGGIIWADGNGYNYGRGMLSDSAAVRGLRDVDYCSGAAIAVRAELFRAVGGFDEDYAPAYYEDVDLAFAVRRAGYRVVVQPESVVTHLEGASNGVEATGGLKRFQRVNREVFRRKWRTELLEQRTLNGPADLWAARQRHRGGMVLIADATVPTPDQDAGSRRITAVIDELIAIGMSVHFAVHSPEANQPYVRDLERKGVTVLVSGEEQVRFLAEAGPQLSLVILCRPEVAVPYLEEVYRRAPQALLVYDTVDMHALRLNRQAQVEGDPNLARMADLIWLNELSAMRAADVTFVVSEVERELLAQVVPDIEVRVLSLIHEPIETSPDLAGRAGVLFVGGYQHLPNIDAAVWATTEIMPLVRESTPGAALRLVGSNMTAEVAALAGTFVEASGWEPDLIPVYRGARVVIAPLRYGAGVKGKVVEAIQHGVPVVGTSIAFEGIGLVDGVVVADNAVDLAAAVARLLTDDDLWRRTAGSGQASVARQFSSSAARRVLEEVLAGGAENRRTPQSPWVAADSGAKLPT